MATPLRDGAAFPLDGAVVPALLLLVARDVLLFDPPRALAWRLLHDERLPSALALHLDPRFDLDPLALVLGALLSALAIAYLAAALRGASVRTRALLLAAGATVGVILPTAGFVALGFATGRPYGQDGGVVQLPLAMEKILHGESPYGADYSDSLLGKQARVSDFWSERGGNPILRHHAYLPGTHLLHAPPYLLARLAAGPGEPPGDAARRVFDPRMVSLVAWGVAALLAARLAAGPAAALCAAAVVLVNPLVWWAQVFGANDLVAGALLLGAVGLARAGRGTAAAAVLGLACATKQLAWPYAPFLLAHLAGWTSLPHALSRRGLRALLRPAAVCGVVFAVVVLPVALLDLRAFWADIVLYNAGLAGQDNYPFGGTPGFGLANLVIYAGRIRSLLDPYPLGRAYVVLVPLGLLLLRAQVRAASACAALVTGSAALLLALYVSRVVHPNYLLLAATLLPIGLLAGSRLRVEADVPIVGLGLLGLAVEITGHEPLRAVWADAALARWPDRLTGAAAALLPRAGADLTLDPLGLLFGALAAGAGIAFIVAGVLGASRRVRMGVLAAALLLAVVAPTAIVIQVGQATGRVRAQDAWLAARISAGTEPRLLWPTSFRREPGGTWPGSATPATDPLARVADWVGIADLRALTLLALAGCAVLLRRSPVALGVLCTPVAALGVMGGSSDALALLALLLVTAAPPGAAAASGALVLSAPRALAAAAFLTGRMDPRRAMALAAGLVGGIALAGGAWWTWPADVEPGIGLVNLLLATGIAVPGAATALALGAIVVGGNSLFYWGPARPHPAGAALALLAALWILPGASPHDLGAPLVLLALAAVPKEAAQ